MIARMLRAHDIASATVAALAELAWVVATAARARCGR